MLNKKIQKIRKHKINGEVRFPQVRLIGDGEPKLMSSFEASQIAKNEGKDLILINETQDPPIVKIEDYNKFIYNLEKSQKERKKLHQKVEIKEIQLSCDIGISDLLTKSKKAKEILEDGNKVKCVCKLKGRQKSMPERGKIIMEKFFEILIDICQEDETLKYDGNKWQMIIKQKK
jgi:translation initiation factor IF-3